MAGRKASPTALKLIKGNPGKRAINKAEPKPKAVRPRKPAHIDAKAKRYWEDLCKILEDMGVLTIADGKALEMLCDAYADYRDCQAIVKKEGRTYITFSVAGDKLIKAHPAVSQASDAWKRVKSMMSEFGLTPSSRSGVKGKSADIDPLEAFLDRGK